MTEEQKSDELINKFSTKTVLSRNRCIECAIICVDEIINNHEFPATKESGLLCNKSYWQEVKTILENKLK